MARPAPPSDDASPGRLIATMLGIVGILLLGSLAWSAVGALLSAFGAAASAFSNATPPIATLAPVVAVTPSPVVVVVTSTSQATSVTIEPTSPAIPTATPGPAVATPTVATAGRNPWILLPLPEPGSRVPPGPIVVEARGRGDAAITTMRLDLDGAPLPVALEQRSESTWRGSASTRVAAGQHNVRATVMDAEGRTGSYRWTFMVAPGP